MWEFSDTSAAHGIVKTINEMTANLQILDVGVDTSTTTGSLVLNLLGAVAQFEREMMLER
jgi:DNA invertase Pin-like site-specific DNA recombinase